MRRYSRSKNNDSDLTGIIGFLIIVMISCVVKILSKYWLIVVIILSIVLIYLIVRIIIDMDFKSTFKKPYLYYKGNHSEAWLKELEKSDSFYDKQKAQSVKRGIYGENSLIYELEHSNIPMYIMHDLKLEYNGNKSQIDAVAITKKDIYFLEAKNLNCNVDIDSDGTITRNYRRNKRGFKNTITQTDKHKMLIEEIFKLEKIKKPRNFWSVLTNDNSYVKYKSDAEDIKEKIIRNDKLVINIKQKEKNKHVIRKEADVKRICDDILKYEVKEDI